MNSIFLTLRVGTSFRTLLSWSLIALPISWGVVLNFTKSSINKRLIPSNSFWVASLTVQAPRCLDGNQIVMRSDELLGRFCGTNRWICDKRVAFPPLGAAKAPYSPQRVIPILWTVAAIPHRSLEPRRDVWRKR